MIKQERLRINLSTVYLCVIVVYAILREVIPLSNIIESEILSYGFFGFGLILILWNVLAAKSLLKLFENPLLVVFILICMLSTVVNYRYGLFSNIKAIGWLCIYFFLLYALGKSAPGKKPMIAFFYVSIVTIAVLVAFSLPMYFFQVDYTSVNDKIIGSLSNQGFSREYSRLWGIFADPNTAAVYALAAMTMGAWLLVQTKHLAGKLLLILLELIMLSYVILSGSRTAMVAMAAGCAVAGFFYTWNRFFDKGLKKFLFSLLALFLSAVIAAAVFIGVKFLLPYEKELIVNAVPLSIQDQIHRFYDDLYRAGDVEIVEGYLFVDQAPSETPEEGLSSEVSETAPPSVLPDSESEPENALEQLGRDDWSEKSDISNGRFSIWLDAIEIFTKSPVIGASPRGASSFGRAHCPNNDISQFGYAAHNTWLEVLMGTGILGLISALFILLKSFLRSIQGLRKGIFNGSCSVCAVLVIELLCASLLLSDIFFVFTFGGVCFWYILGSLDGSLEQAERAEFEHMERNRVLVYGPKDPVGGVEKIVYEYVSRITEQHPELSFDFVEYGTSFSMEESLQQLGCRVIYLPSRKRNFIRYKKAIKALFAQTPYLAVWGNYSGLTNIDLLVYGKRYGVPVRIAHSHGARLYWGSSMMKYVVHILHYFNKLRLTEYATDYWACSAMAGTFMFPKTVYNQIALVPNAVDLEKFQSSPEDRQAVRREFGIPEDCIVVGHVARMCEVKNQDFLLNTMRALVNRDPHARLLFVGDGERRDSLQELTDELGIGDNVLFTGQRQDVSRLLNAMDVFVLCSFSEGLSISAVEAQAAGLPCILPTTISTETDISKNVTFLPLSAGPEEWAARIAACAAAGSHDVHEQIVAQGYEINGAAEKLYAAFTAKDTGAYFLKLGELN